MEANQTTRSIHPLMAGAAISVMLVSLVGAAALTGVLPSSHGSITPDVAATQPAPAPATVAAAVPTPAIATTAQAQKKPAVRHKTIVHHRYVTHAAPPAAQTTQVVAQAEPTRSYSPPPVYQQQAPVQQPVAQNSPIGIGVGAVVGGLLGNQIGGGNGKTLATIAGAVGGGYVGNEIAKRY
jgi:uncharacterized protein YcfJ